MKRGKSFEDVLRDDYIIDFMGPRLTSQVTKVAELHLDVGIAALLPV